MREACEWVVVVVVAVQDWTFELYTYYSLLLLSHSLDIFFACIFTFFSRFIKQKRQFFSERKRIIGILQKFSLRTVDSALEVD